MPDLMDSLRLFRGVLAAIALGLLVGAYGMSGPLDRGLLRRPHLLRWLFWVPAGLGTLLVVALSGGLGALGAFGSGVSSYDPAFWGLGLALAAVLHLGLALAPMTWTRPGRWAWIAVLALLVSAILYGAMAYSAFTEFDLYIMETVSPVEDSPGVFPSSPELALEMKKLMMQAVAIGAVTAGVSFLDTLGIFLILRSWRRRSVALAM